MALRLKYAGIDAELHVERDLETALDDAVAGAAGTRLFALPTYTALLELRDLLARRGLARRWSELIDRRIIWHDVENGSYQADLRLWHRLADEAGGPVLDLGAGTGRVAIELAAAGHEVTAVESDPLLLDELGRRARDRELSIARWTADARALTPVEGFALVIAPMQFVQIMGGAAQRSDLLRRAAACLVPGGAFAAAISDLDEAVAADDAGATAARRRRAPRLGLLEPPARRPPRARRGGGRMAAPGGLPRGRAHRGATRAPARLAVGRGARA